MTTNVFALPAAQFKVILLLVMTLLARLQLFKFDNWASTVISVFWLIKAFCWVFMETSNPLVVFITSVIVNEGK